MNVKPSPAVLDRVLAILGPRALKDRPLGPLTTYRVGGPAAVFMTIENPGDLRAIWLAAAETGLPVLVVGKGSNLLVADAGFPGIALALGRDYESVVPAASCVQAGGAAYLPVVARRCAAAGLGGLEWAVGIPGSVGGGVCMNAGGHGGDIKSVILGAEVYDLAVGERLHMEPSQLGLSYRRSALRAEQVVLSVRFAGQQVDTAQSRARIDEIVRWRRLHQPGGANAGSVFVNPPGDTAGRLVEEVGLKGFRIGGAVVSPLHANFISAEPSGSADDIATLIDEVRRRVADTTGTVLELECRLVGRFTSGSSRR